MLLMFHYLRALLIFSIRCHYASCHFAISCHFFHIAASIDYNIAAADEIITIR